MHPKNQYFGQKIAKKWNSSVRKNAYDIMNSANQTNMITKIMSNNMLRPVTGRENEKYCKNRDLWWKIHKFIAFLVKKMHFEACVTRSKRHAERAYLTRWRKPVSRTHLGALQSDSRQWRAAECILVMKSEENDWNWLKSLISKPSQLRTGGVFLRQTWIYTWEES